MSTAVRSANPYRMGSIFYSIFFGTYGIFEPFIFPYFQQIGLNGKQIGILLSLPPLVFLFISPAVAALADRKAWRIRLLAGLTLLNGILYFFYQFPRAFYAVLLMTLLIALVRGPTQPIADSLILRMAVRHEIDYGSMRRWGSLFYAIMAVICGLLWEWFDISLLFPATALGFIAVALMTLRMEENPPVSENARAPWSMILGNPVLLSLFISAVLMGATFNSFNYSGMFMVHLGGGERMIGILLGVTAMAEVPMMQYASYWMRRLGPMQALLASYGIFALAFLTGALATAPWMLLVAGGFNGMGFGLAIIAILVTFDRRAPDNWSSSVQSMVSVGIFGIAPFLSSFLFGAVYDIWPAGVYALSLLLILLAGVTLWLAMRFEKRSIMQADSLVTQPVTGEKQP